MFQAIDLQDVTRQVSASLEALGHRYEIRTLRGRGRGGAPTGRSVVEYTLPDVAFGDGLGGLRGRLYLLNSNNGRTSFQFKVGFLRLVCANGLCVGEDVFDQRLRHVAGPKLGSWLQDIPGIVASAVAALSAAHAKLARLATAPVLAPLATIAALQARGVVSKRAGDEAFVAVLRGTTRPEDNAHTVFGLYQIINEAERRHRRSVVVALTQDARVLAALEAAAA